MLKNYDQLETNEEYAKGSLRGIVGLAPFIGTWLNEIFFNARARLHQKRINEFVIQLGEDFKRLDVEKLDQEYLSSEDFFDFTYEIVERVARTKNQKKKERLRKLLLHQMEQPVISEHIEAFVDLLARIEEIEIVILKHLLTYTKKLEGAHIKVFELEKKRETLKKNLKVEEERHEGGFANNFQKVRNEIFQLEKEMKVMNDKIYEAGRDFDSNTMKFGEERVGFYLEALTNKALTVKRPVPKSNSVIGFENIFVISRYGENFLEFIKEEV